MKTIEIQVTLTDRPNVRETLPKEAQFKASELRALPRVQEGFYATGRV
jgi:hypothetical protein